MSVLHWNRQTKCRSKKFVTWGADSVQYDQGDEGDGKADVPFEPGD